MTDSIQPPLNTRAERIAHNESWARHLNQYRAEALEFMGDMDFRCECERTTCTAKIPMTAEEWEKLRANPRAFAVAPGHAAEGVERVTSDHGDYCVVEKLGEAGEVAERLAKGSATR